MAKYLVADLWEDVCQAVEERQHNPANFERIYIGRIENPIHSPVHTRKYKHKKSKKLTESNFHLSSPLETVRLTPREVQVAYLICEGATNQKVADKMSLSVRTVEYYIKNIRKKTLAVNKASLIQLILKTDFFDRVTETPSVSDFSLPSRPAKAS